MSEVLLSFSLPEGISGPVILDLRAPPPLIVGISEHDYTFADGHDSFIELCSNSRVVIFMGGFQGR